MGEALSTTTSARTGTTAGVTLLPAQSWMAEVTWTSYMPPGRSGDAGTNSAPLAPYWSVPFTAVACPAWVTEMPSSPASPSVKPITIGPLTGGDARGVTSCGGVWSTCHWYCWLVVWKDWLVTDTRKVCVPSPMPASPAPLPLQPTALPSNVQATELAGSPAVSPSE